MMDFPNAARRELSVIVPTYDESENIGLLIERLGAVLADIDHEIVVVDDDSPDLTWQMVERVGESDDRVRIVRRLGCRGLSSAVIAGLLEARGDCLAVMDGDLQHDEFILPDMFRQIVDEGFDVCVGSREVTGGSYGKWSKGRKLMSVGARRLAHLVVGEVVQDPMSGYFAMSRDYFEATVEDVNPQGFKILLEFLARGRQPKVAEVGYTFRERLRGETKLDVSVVLEYVLALVNLRFGWREPLPTRVIRRRAPTLGVEVSPAKITRSRRVADLATGSPPVVRRTDPAWWRDREPSESEQGLVDETSTEQPAGRWSIREPADGA